MALWVIATMGDGKGGQNIGKHGEDAFPRDT
jgi:hypothetical protein